MTELKSDFLRESQARGLIYQGTNLANLDERMVKGSVAAYIGFDATATSLTVGGLVQIMRLRLLQRTGHKPIILMGDGTTLIGDPSGKDTQRQLLSPEKIDDNIKGIESIFAKYIDFNDGPTGAVIVRNHQWLKNLNYLKFLRDYGRHFSVNRMLSFESVKVRLEREQPLSFLEFNYMILQAYDYWYLFKHYNCILQLGGSDQWGNILNGIELIRRIENQETYGLTGTLITTADGRKMGKSEQGAVWLNSDLLSPYDYWQFWRNTQDADVGRFLRLFTDLPLKEIARMESLQGAELNEAKKILADETTRLCHGDTAVNDAHKAVQKLFAHQFADLGSLTETLPTVDIAVSQMQQGLLLIDALIMTGLSTSKGEARRLIRAQSIRINDQNVNDELYALKNIDITVENIIKISAGKKRHALIRILD